MTMSWAPREWSPASLESSTASRAARRRPLRRGAGALVRVAARPRKAAVAVGGSRLGHGPNPTRRVAARDHNGAELSTGAAIDTARGCEHCGVPESQPRSGA